MHYIDRRKLLGSSIAAAATCALGLPFIPSAKAAEFSFKFGSDIPMSHPINVRMKEAAQEVAEKTDGKVAITIYPNSELGSDQDMFSQLRIGALDFFVLSGSNALGTLVPKAAIQGIGFAFKDDAQVYAAMDGELGVMVRGLIEAAGLNVLDKIWANGFRQMTSSEKPIFVPSDLHGMKVRVPPGPMWVSLFRALGSAPTTISFGEVYSALQTKIVDGEESSLTTIAVAKLYEVQKYCSMTNHMWDGFWFLMNRRSWKRIPEATQEIVANAVNAAALREREDIATQNASLQNALQSKGMKFNSTNPDEFRAVLRKAGFYADWHRRFGDKEWSLLEKVTGPLA